jgi:hypothetical protein
MSFAIHPELFAALGRAGREVKLFPLPYPPAVVSAPQCTAAEPRALSASPAPAAEMIETENGPKEQPMRIAEMTWNEGTEEYEEDEDEAVGSVDWKEHANTILEIVDDQLAAFGLEIVQYDTDGDYYMWRIEKRAVESGAQSEIVSLDAERLVRLAERIGQKEIERNGGKE